MRGYTTRDVAELLSMPAAKVRAFARAGFLSPHRDARGHYRFSFNDIILLRAAKKLSAANIHSRQIWRALRILRDQLPQGQSLASLRIVAEGDRVVVREKATSWHPDSGQLTLDFSVAEIASEIAPLVRKVAKAAETSQTLGSDDWYDLGVDLELACATEDAKRAYRSALELDSTNADAHINLGRLLHEEGQSKRAETHYRRAFSVTPDNAIAVYNLGTALQDQGRLKEASDAYEEAVRLVPDFADAHYNLAQLHEKLGNRATALQHLARYKALTKSSPRPSPRG